LIEFPHTEDNLAEYVGRVLRAEFRSDEAGYEFAVHWSGGGREFPLARGKVQALLASIRAKDLGDETALYTDTSFEIIVNEESPFPSRRIRDDTIRVTDAESTITYEVSPASDEYLLWLIATASSRGSLRDLGLGIFPTRLRLERLLAEERIDLDALDVLRALSTRALTLKLTSTNRLSLKRFQAGTYSFLFHLAYNLDVALVPQRYFEEVSRRGRISRMRRSTTDELDPPLAFTTRIL
jgi:hypothetical protein